MRRASLAAAVLAAAGGLLLTGAAAAQSARPYLSWPGRGEATPPGARAAAAPAPVGRGPGRPNPVIPHGGAAARGSPSAAPARRTLTPADAWLRPPSPPAAPALAAAAPSPTPGYLPDRAGGGQAVPAELIHPAPVRTPGPAPVGPPDPMAPRRDAPIFQVQPPAPPPAAAAAGSGDAAPQGGRYYSVHRQNGRRPDALTVPAPTYVDALVVSGVETLASRDLAAPEPGPTLIRGRNGDMRAAPAPSDGDHQ